MTRTTIEGEELCRRLAIAHKAGKFRTLKEAEDYLRGEGEHFHSTAIKRAVDEHGYKYGIARDGRKYTWGRPRPAPVPETNGHGPVNRLIGLNGTHAVPSIVPPCPGDIQAAMDLLAESFPGFSVGLLLTPQPK